MNNKDDRDTGLGQSATNQNDSGTPTQSNVEENKTPESTVTSQAVDQIHHGDQNQADSDKNTLAQTAIASQEEEEKKETETTQEKYEFVRDIGLYATGSTTKISETFDFMCALGLPHSVSAEFV